MQIQNLKYKLSLNVSLLHGLKFPYTKHCSFIALKALDKSSFLKSESSLVFFWWTGKPGLTGGQSLAGEKVNSFSLSPWTQGEVTFWFPFHAINIWFSCKVTAIVETGFMLSVLLKSKRSLFSYVLFYCVTGK